MLVNTSNCRSIAAWAEPGGSGFSSAHLLMIRTGKICLFVRNKKSSHESLQFEKKLTHFGALPADRLLLLAAREYNRPA